MRPRCGKQNNGDQADTIQPHLHSRGTNQRLFLLTSHGGNKRSPGRLLPRIVAKQAVKQVVLPASIDAQILPRIALAMESDLFEEADRGVVVRQAGRLDPVEVERVEGEADDRADGARS